MIPSMNPSESPPFHTLDEYTFLNLSHYQLMDPHRDHGYDKKGIEAGGKTLPPHDQAPVLPLEPGKRPLNCVARDVLFDRAAARRFGLPSAFGHLGSDPTAAEATPEVFGIIPVICRDALEPCARSAPCAGAHGEGVRQRDDLGALLAIRGRGPRGQGPACPVSEAVDEEPFPLPAMGDTLTTSLARGKRRRRWPRTATASSRVPRPAQAGGLAWPPASRRPAKAATTGVRHSWGPMGAAGELTPAAAGEQEVAQCVHHVANGSMRHTSAPLRWLWGQQLGKELPLQVTSPCERAGHRTLLEPWRVLWHRKQVSGIGSCIGHELSSMLTSSSLKRMVNEAIQNLKSDPLQQSEWVKIAMIVGNLPISEDLAAEFKDVVRQLNFRSLDMINPSTAMLALRVASDQAIHFNDEAFRLYCEIGLLEIIKTQASRDNGSANPDVDLFLDDAVELSIRPGDVGATSKAFSKLLQNMFDAWPQLATRWRPGLSMLVGEPPARQLHGIWPLVLRMRALDRRP
jgi:hypothetical protein